MLLTLFCARWCNLMGLEDKTIRSFGIHVDRVRLLVSLTAVLLLKKNGGIYGK